MEHQLTDQQVAKIGEALIARRKIEAIKIYREATGAGLKESKDFIEALIPRLQQQDPVKYAGLAAQGKGCASVLLVGCVFGAVLAWLALRAA